MQVVQRNHFAVFWLLSVLAWAALLAPALRAHGASIVVVSAASLARDVPVAPNSIAVVEGEFAERTTRAPGGVPQVELDSVTAEIEYAGRTQYVRIFAVKPRRLEFLVPDLPSGTAHIEVRRGVRVLADGEFEVRRVSPGLFSAANTGGGLAAAVAERVNVADGASTQEDVAFFNRERGTYEPILLTPAGTGSELHVIFLGTGIRHGAQLALRIGGVSVPASLLARAEDSPGLDKVRAGPLPAALASRQTVDVVLTVDGIESNPVQVAFSSSHGEAVTFSNQIVRLFQGNCQTCHRPDQVAPFSLTDYESARPWAQAIKQATHTRYMPPWKPVPGYGEFEGERRLSDAQIAQIARWVDAGAPEGDPADLPEPLVFDPDWALGPPDVILQTPEYVPDPSGEDDYRCFSIRIPPEITSRKSIVGLELQPGNRRIVHHILVFADPAGESQKFEAAQNDGQPGYECFGSAGIGPGGFLPGVESYLYAGWVPGNSPQVLPEGSGYYLRPGAYAVVQVHYHPDGSEQGDSTRLGLHFADQPTPNNSIIIPVMNTDFEIPAGEPRHEVRMEFGLDNLTEFELPPFLLSFLESRGIFPAKMSAVVPHMHLLGREIQMERVSATGKRTPMIRIDDWDFDWQDMYTFVEPLTLEVDDRLEAKAYFDNSAANPRNPNDPPVAVTWGERTTDEMFIVFIRLEVKNACADSLLGLFIGCPAP